MGRLLLGEDLGLYEDGVAQSVSTPLVVQPTKAELPYYDSRFIGRALTVAADGSLTWVLNEHIPDVDARSEGKILVINSQGNAEWRYPVPGGGIVEDEVSTTDDTGLGNLYYGTTTPLSAVEGGLFICTRSITGVTPPAAPTEAPVLSAGTPVGRVVTLTWTAVARATHYEIQVDNEPVLVVTGTTYDITLPPATVEVEMRAYNASGFGPESNEVTVTIANEPPPPVTNLRPIEVARGTVTVAWDYTLPEDFDFYEIGASHGTLTSDDPNRTATVTGAPDSTDVTFLVLVHDQGGAVSETVFVIVRTPDAPLPTAPPTPGNFRVTRTGYSSADFAWNASTGATSYEISKDGTNWTSVGTALIYAWTGLAEQKTYTLRVRAVNAGGVSAIAAKSVTTLAKIHHYNTTTQRRNFGYGAETWPSVLQYHSSGIIFTNDNWAGQANSNNYLYAFDNNLNTGPFSQQPDRWIQFQFVNFTAAYLHQVIGWWGYPGTFSWQAINAGGVVMQRGIYAGSTSQLGGVPNSVNNTAVGPVKWVQLSFAAGMGSPGWFKLREWRLDAEQVTGTTPVYNPA